MVADSTRVMALRWWRMRMRPRQGFLVVVSRECKERSGSSQTKREKRKR